MHKSRLAGFIIDCKDATPSAAALFWGRALGMKSLGADGELYERLDSSGRDLTIEVQRVSHESRVHLDIESTDVDAEATRLEALGARKVEKVHNWWLMEAPTGQRFCVDRTEVSQRDYRAFVRATAGDAGGQPDVCFFNSTYTKAQFTEPADCTGRLDDEATADLPVTCIDWCDARAFCSWKGKRLCGKVGGGPVPFGPEVVNPAVDQWYAGCSSLGEHEYFYGDEYDPSRCNGGDRVGDGAGVLWEVGSRPECTGGPNGEVFDMIGNVGEFVDSCLPAPDGGPSFLDYCVYRGGTAGTKDEQGSHAYLRCGRAPPPEQNTAATRNYGASFIGFRCCADLP